MTETETFVFPRSVGRYYRSIVNAFKKTFILTFKLIFSYLQSALSNYNSFQGSSYFTIIGFDKYFLDVK